MISKILLVLIIIFSATVKIVSANPVSWKDEKAYFPYPVIFIHGINSNAHTWSASINTLKQYFADQYKKIYIFNPITQQQEEYTPKLPGLLYLEVFEYGDLKGNGKDTSGSFNHLDTYAPGLDDKVKKVLETYYGSTWQSNPNAKVILVAHSQGGLIARDYLRKHGGGRVDRLITVGTPHRGSYLPDLAAGAYAGAYVLTAWGFTNPIWWGLELGFIVKILFSGARPFLLNLRSGAMKDLTIGSEFLEGSNGINKTAPPVPTICLVSNLGGTLRPGDGAVSVESQKGILKGQSAFIPEALIEITPAVKHEEETKQYEPVFKAMEGIDMLNIPEVKINTTNLNPYVSQPVIWGEYTDYLPAFAGLKVELTGLVNGAQQNSETFTNANGYLTGSADNIHGLFNQPLLGTSPKSYKLLAGGLADNGKEIKLKAKISKEHSSAYPFYISTEDEYTYQYLSFIYGTAPSDEAQEVTLDTPIVIYCQEKVRAETVNANTVRITPALAGAFTVQGKAITFTPAAPLQDTTHYTVTIKGDDPATEDDPATPYLIENLEGVQWYANGSSDTLEWELDRENT